MSLPSKSPRNYCNNKDLLLEIHKSKKTFCYFTKPEYSDYDIIVQTKEDIPLSIVDATSNRSKRLGIETKDIKVTDLVFRVVCWDHIPETPKKVKKDRSSSKKASKSSADYFAEEADDLMIDDENEEVELSPIAMTHVKLNFPPFVHYRILTNGDLELVGKSHWKGDLQTGEYCRDHGKVTNTLATMWMKMCERYASKSNYRGYSFKDEMVCQGILQLSIVGLQFDESKSENPFAFYTQCITNAFNRVLNLEKKMRDIRDDLMQEASLNPSYTRQNSEHVDYGSDDQ